MGIDVHGLNLLQFAAARQPLGRVITIGRQGLNVAPYKLRDMLGADRLPTPDRYCERLLMETLGAESVASIDKSDFEGATIIADMNRPIEVGATFDTVIDAGTLEHIFDVRQALANVSALCREGGQILHVLPANNQNGHGFYQFSPELFFSLYSARNGYRDTRVFLVSDFIKSRWYEVMRPTPGERVNVTSLLRTTVLVRTIRGAEVSDVDVQQSDYVARWTDNSAPAATPAAVPTTTARSLKATIDRFQPVSRVTRGGLYRARTLLAVRSQLRGGHPNLRRIAVHELVSGA